MEQTNWKPDAPYCVYMHVGPSGFVYIGQTCERLLSKRFRNGLGYSSSPHFFRAIKKYGWDNFDHVIIEDGLTKQEADDLEIKLILEYKSRGISYNLSDGGEGVRKPISEETRIKISKANKGQIPWNKGKTGIYSDETRKKISESQIGKHHTDEYKKMMSDIMSNRAIVTKGGVTKYVLLNILQQYLDAGWVKDIGNSRNACIGRIQITNGVTNKMIKPTELQQYLDAGWRRGMPDDFSKKCRACSKMKWMNNGTKNARILEDLISEYISNGWVLGRLKKSK